MNRHLQQASTDATRVALNMQRALKLRAERGFSYRKIGDALGVSHVTAHTYVIDALREVRVQYAEDAHEVRTLELARLDGIHGRLNTAMIAAMREKDWNTVATLAARMVQVSERRASLLGLDVTKYMPLIPSVPSGAEADMSRLSIEEMQTLEALAMKAAGIEEKPFGLLPEGEIFQEHADETPPIG